MIHLITGGARSGKSRVALELAEAINGPVDFVATAEALDDEMRARVVAHRAERGPRFRTWESALDPMQTIRELPGGGAIVLDCLTLWVANQIFADRSDEDIESASRSLCVALLATGRSSLVVTNEVGLGIVPADALSRRYRDTLGRTNQIVASAAHRVTFMVSGLPLRVR